MTAPAPSPALPAPAPLARTKGSPEAKRDLAFYTVFGLIWLALWLAGLPRPNVDDSFFAGIAVRLAQHGEIANPWCAGWLGFLPDVSTKQFLVQPPLYPFALATWLRVWGISAASMTAWICTLGFAFLVCLWRLLRALDVQRSVAILAPLVAGGWILHRGLRPEAFALLCLAAGQGVLLRRRTFAGALLGGTLNGLAVITHPFWIVFAASGTLLQLWDARQQRTVFRALLLGLSAGAFASLAILLAIVGRNFSQLIHDVWVHAHFVSATANPFVRFIDQFRVGYDGYVHEIVLALSTWGWLSAPERDTRRARMGLFFVFACGALGLALYPGPCAIYLVLIIAMVPLVFTPTALTSGQRAIRVLPAVLFVGWFALQHTVQLLADRTGDESALRPRVLAYLEETRPEQILFDATTLRTVFDYRPPLGAIDLGWAWSPGRSERWLAPAAMHPRDVWIVNPSWSRTILADAAPRATFTLRGRTLNSVTLGRRVFVLAGRELPSFSTAPR